ncbi:MAG TPA: DUF58 domain-containing protein [Candidatus Acidoferrales bacterium]|jgi:uncharacterized protein (DUF58 family)|nr:DUF58 domain-containing protein [Candidatus Acidoferrales bacterium]
MDPAIRQALGDGEKTGLRYALQIPQVATSGWTGTRSGRRTGSSIDFQDYREYQPGDDLRFIDWGIYARTDRLTVKLFREEVTPHLDLILDGSRSMNLAHTAKPAAAARLAALLATSAANAQCTRAVWLSGEGFQRLPNDTLTPSAWDRLDLDSLRTPGQSLEILPPKFRRLGVRVLVSDLLWPGEPMPLLRRLRDGAAALFVIQLLAREDVEPPEHGNLRVVDSETGDEREIYIDSSIARQYSENLAQLQQSWSDACRQCGAQMTTLIAEDLENSLGELEAMHLIVPA